MGYEDEEELFDDVADDELYQSQKSATIYMLQCSNSMLEQYDSREPSLMRQVLAGLRDSFLSMMVSGSEYELFGLYLFGAETEERENKQAQHVKTVIELGSDKTVEHMAFLLELLNGNELEEFCKPAEEAANGELDVSRLLTFAHSTMERSVTNVPRRQYVVITNTDDPCPNANMNAIKQNAQDITDQGGTIVPTLVRIPGQTLDPSRFWGELPLQPEIGELSEQEPVAVDLIDASKFGSTIFSKRFTKRADGQVVIQFGEVDADGVGQPGAKAGIGIGCKTFVLTKPQSIPPFIWVSQRDNQTTEAKPSTSYVVKDGGNGQLLSNEQINTRQLKFGYGGNEPLYFSKEMADELQHSAHKLNAPPGRLQIIAFKDMKLFQPYFVYGVTRFLYPTDGKLEKSIRAFVALREAMLEKSVFAIAWCAVKRNSQPRFYAVMPSVEKFDETLNAFVIPEGMFMLPLAFRDEIRPVPPGPSLVNPDPQETSQFMGSLASSLLGEDVDQSAPSSITKMRKKSYEPRRYQNYQLQNFYQELAMHALAIDETPVKDSTTITHKKKLGIDKLVGPAVQNTNAWFEQNKNQMFKRGDQDGEDEGAERLAPGGNSEDEISVAEMRAWLASENGDRQYTVKDLKEFCKKHNIGLQPKWTKKNIRDAIAEQLGS